MPARRSARARTTRSDGPVPGLLDKLEWRQAGPFRGGRVGAVAGDPKDRNTFYFGSTGGGVWKTQDAGHYWENMSDGFFKRASVGAIAVAGSDPNVVYVGMGESCIRGNVSHGDGVYRSTDGGKTWAHLGLEKTRNIGKVRVHPGDPDTAYVAALGHAHGANPERGVYRTRDGGKTWKRVLFRNEKAGAIDLSVDANNPRILYATFWEAIRRPWELVSGGPGSGIFRSNDGGDTWKELTRARGLPKGTLGKVGISASAAKSGRVYAIVEAEDGGVYRSEDFGESWTRGSEDRNLRQRAWYYDHIYADPKDPETVWVLNVDAWRSSDGGKTFEQMSIPHGDHHDLWIDPSDPARMIEGNDGGAVVTLNAGETWSGVYNQPTAEFYHVITDTQTPYRIYGAQQDNTTMTIPSRAPIAGITGADMFAVGGGESGYIAIRPDAPNIVFAGNYQGIITRYDRRTGQSRNIMVWPESTAGEGAGDAKYRFQWTCPIVLSPHDPNVLYHAGNRVFRTRDEGTSWQAISPDLTRNDKGKLGPSGGPITKDNTGAEYYCTVFSFVESTLVKGLFWAGSDDGLVHVSRDDGKSWRNVTPPGIKPWTLISLIEASPHDPATAYVAATRYKLDDFAPMLFKTTNYGRTWTKITNGIRSDDFTRAIREDPEKRDLLYAGTETGVYASFDGGRRWQRLGGNLPIVPIHDLVVKEGDLVLGTHGRSFWILDDLAPLRQYAAQIARERAHVFTPKPTVRYRVDMGFPQPPKIGKNYRMTGATMVTYRQVDKPTGEKVAQNIDAGSNPLPGVPLQFWLKDKAKEAKLGFYSGTKLIREFKSAPPEEAPAAGKKEQPTQTAPQGTAQPPQTKEPKVATAAGLNRFVWNMRYPDATKIEGEGGTWEAFENQLVGPQVAPGSYRARLTVDGHTLETPFEIRKDPRVSASHDDLEAQFDLAVKVHAKLSETHATINAIRKLKQQLDLWESRAREQGGVARLVSAIAALRKRASAVEEELVQVKAKSRQDTLNYPAKLNSKLAGLLGSVGGADFAPTEGMRDVFADLSRRIDAQIKKWEALKRTDIPGLDRQVRASGVPALGVGAKPVRIRGTRATRARAARGRVRRRATAP
ncbi:MAG TPA: glycosyl hydrolase [Candidatus Limnocylindria bacterium]|nr:glycosyl hydrolase [Candidatus Limnocylindria bacterium]